MDIQILRDGRQMGPYTEEAVHALLKEGSVLVNDLAWRPGFPDWVPLMNVLYPAATRQPATARQKAFLVYAGVAFAPDISKDDASLLVNDAMEHPKDPARLARWNEERLHLHPALFAAEIQARKENRPQHFLEVCHGEGAAFFDKVTKAHCQVLVSHLDVHAPNWDANEKEAAMKHFFPALAEKFPQLVTEEGKAKFKAPDKTPGAGRPKSSPIAAKTRPSTGPTVGKVVYAMARGVLLGLVILALLWLGRGFFTGKPAAPKASAPTAEASATSAPEAAAPAVASADTTAPEPQAAAKKKPRKKPAEPEAATAAAAAAPSPAPAVAASEPAGTAPSPALPVAGEAPTATPTPALIPASQPRTSVVLTKPIDITLPFGKISVPAGTTVKIVSHTGPVLTVRYLDHEATIPASSTDLGTDLTAAAPQ